MNRLNLIIKFLSGVFLVVLLCPINVDAQKKTTKTPTRKVLEPTAPVKKSSTIVSYSISESGDTINIIDSENRKQGWWVENNPTSKIIEGERDFFVGTYLNNLKNGKWQNYVGHQLVLDENYKLGERDGEVKIYEEGKLSVKGNYKAINKNKIYDTIEIEDVNGAWLTKIVKTDKGSYRQGEWIYYYPNTNKVMRREFYYLDDLIDSKDYDLYDSMEVKKIQEVRKTVQKPAMWNYSKKSDAPRYSDVNPDGKGVKPNVRTIPKKKK